MIYHFIGCSINYRSKKPEQNVKNSRSLLLLQIISLKNVIKYHLLHYPATLMERGMERERN